MSRDELRDRVQQVLESLVVRSVLAVAFGVLVALVGWVLKTSVDTSIEVGQIKTMSDQHSEQLREIRQELRDQELRDRSR